LNRLNKSEFDRSSRGGKRDGDSDAGSQASIKSKKSTKLNPKRYWTRVLSISHRMIECEEKFDV